MTNPTYPVPTTVEEEIALEKALAARSLEKFEAAKAMFAGEGYQAFREQLDGLIALRLPASSATAQNAANLTRFLDTMRQGVEQDRSTADALVNPPPAPTVPPVPV